MDDLLRAIVADPSSAPSTWLVLADWLDDHSDPRAELVRLQHDTTCFPDLTDYERDERVRQLLLSGVHPCVPRRTAPAGIEMAWLPAGKFLMGTPKGNPYFEPAEEPQHEVEITRPFFLGVYPVTVEQFRQFVRQTGHRTGAESGHPASVWRDDNWVTDPSASWENPGLEQTDDHPVTCVNWNDARMFCWWLHQLDPTCLYRLPTEAEWEYACRAGARRPVTFHFGNALGADLANFDAEAPCGGAPVGPFLRRTTPVGSYPPNAFGLFDMHGNVFEWCHDRFDSSAYSRKRDPDPAGPMDGSEWLVWFDQNTLGREQVKPSPEAESTRVTRGGSWLSDGMYCRSAYRSHLTATISGTTNGFRVVAVPRPSFALTK